MNSNPSRLFFGRGHRQELDKGILELLVKEGITPEIGDVTIGDFGNTETQIKIEREEDSVRGRGVFFCQNYDATKLPNSARFKRPLSINDLLMETIIFGETAKGSKALEVSFLLPELPYETAFIAGLLHTVRGKMWYEIKGDYSELRKNDLRDLGEWIHRRQKSPFLKPGVVLEPQIYIGSAALDMGRRIVKVFSQTRGNQATSIENIAYFEDKTHKVSINDSRLDVEGKDVFYVQNFYEPESNKSVNDNLMEALLFAYHARKKGAGRLTAVLPNMPYERQDKRQGREPLSIKVVADLLYACGYDEVLTVSLHSEESESAFHRIYFDNIPAAPILQAMVTEIMPLERYKKLGLLSTDANGAKLVKNVGIRLEERGYACELAMAAKDRPRAEVVGKTDIVGKGHLSGQYVCVLDDLLASGGSAVSAVREAFKRHGVWYRPPKEVNIFAVSGFLNNGALLLFESLVGEKKVNGVYIANTIPRDYAALNNHYPFLHVFDISHQIADAMYQINTHGSISRLLTQVKHIERIV
jgi:ribose-phosphate pyrophosphokinase